MAAKVLKNQKTKSISDLIRVSEFEEQLRLTVWLAVIGKLSASLAHQSHNDSGSFRVAVEILYDKYVVNSKSPDYL